MPVKLKILFAAGFALLIGLIIGFIAGRAMLERKWSQPYAVVTPAEAEKYASADADPAPKAGTKVLRPMPIGRARVAIAKTTDKDPAISRVASVGAGEEGMELHVTVQNQGTCTITNLAGVAYGFDPRGMPGATNKHGEAFVAFDKLESPIAPGAKGLVSLKLRYSEAATLALAQIDSTECSDGPAWKRQ